MVYPQGRPLLSILSSSQYPTTFLESEALMAEKDIWLPKDEREMLLFYYHELGNISEKKRFINFSDKRYNATISLEARNLISNPSIDYPLEIALSMVGVDIDVTDHFGEDEETIVHIEPLTRALTQDGLDLARKYSHKISFIQLWCMEHKKHWIVIGALWILSLLVTWFVSKVK